MADLGSGLGLQCGIVSLQLSRHQVRGRTLKIGINMFYTMRELAGLIIRTTKQDY